MSANELYEKDSLNKLPDGSPAPRYLCVAEANHSGERKEFIVTEWWYGGKRVETIEESAQARFYEQDAFDKASFTILSITKLEEDE